MTAIVLGVDAIASRQKVGSEARDREERLERGIEVAVCSEGRVGIRRCEQNLELHTERSPYQLTIMIIICAHLPSVAEIAKPCGDVVLGTLCGPVDSRRIATTTVAAEEAVLILAATAHGAGVAEAIVSARRRVAVRETFSCLP